MQADCPELGFFPRYTYDDFTGHNPDVFSEQGNASRADIDLPSGDDLYNTKLYVPGDWERGIMAIRLTFRDSKSLEFVSTDGLIDRDAGFQTKSEELATSNVAVIKQ